MKTIRSSIAVLTLLGAAVGCEHHDDQSAKAKEPHATTWQEQRRIDERRAEEQGREEQRRIDERRAEERRDGRSIGGGPGEPAYAVTKIASARCDREVRCNNVGYKQKYSSRDDCDVRMQADKRDEVNSTQCPVGIDKKQLDACLTSIRDESCNNPLDTVGRLVACRSSSLCVK
jgi:hypothetical protein